MSYRKISKQLREINKNEAERRFGTDRLLRYLGNLICPLFIMLGMSANHISYAGIVVTSCAAAVMITGWGGGLVLGTSIYLFAIVMDYCDGSIARYAGSANFFGRFVDGLFDVINIATFNVAVVFYVFTHFELNPVMQILCLMSPPMAVAGSLIMDRYSAMVRWIKETHDVSIDPTVKAELPKFIFNYLYDCRILAIVSMLFFPLCTIVFLIGFLCINVFLIIFHVKVASQKLNFSTKSGRVHID